MDNFFLKFYYAASQKKKKKIHKMYYINTSINTKNNKIFKKFGLLK